jgi:hypothetical protein
MAGEITKQIRELYQTRKRNSGMRLAAGPNEGKAEHGWKAGGDFLLTWRKPLKNMVGTRRLELLTSTVSKLINLACTTT